MTSRIEIWVNRISMTLLGSFSVIFAIQMWMIVKDTLRLPPVTWNSVRVVTPEIRVGDELVLEYEAMVNQQCPSELRSFLREADGSVVLRWITPGGYTAAAHGTRKILVRLKIENDKTGQFPAIKPGPHTYEVTAIRFCEDGLKIDNLIPRARFVIKE